MLPGNLTQYIVGVIPAILVAITFHEYAHGKAAYMFGDQTAKLQGRLTLNPLAHLDPIGTLLLLVARFGWAKPVPVNPFQFRGDRRRAMLVVSLAGPMMNLALAYLSAVGMTLVTRLGVTGSQYLNLFLYYSLDINVILAIFNLIPVPPLDGSKILASILPSGQERIIYSLEQYGAIILLLLVFTGVIGLILGGPVEGVKQFLLYLSGFSFT